jgi:hypothetical protein
MNILDYIPQLYVTGEYSGGPPALRALAMCLYIPRLTEEYIVFYITPILAATPDGDRPKQDSYSSFRQQNNDN